MTNSHSQPTYYDVIVIGAGPAGYISAIRCAQLGLKTACIDNWCNLQGQNSLGGAHLNAGCVATLALLESSKIYQLLKQGINAHGIFADNITVDIAQVIARKDNIVSDFGRKVADIFNHHHIDYIHGQAKLLNAKQIRVIEAHSKQISLLRAKNIILATGSSSIELPYAPTDGEFIINAASALNLTAVPEKLAIIGGGVIGLELGGIWNRFGAKTILFEAQETFLSLPDHQIAEEAHRIYTQQGLDLRLGARVITARPHNNKVTLCYQDQYGTHTECVDKLIVASGRKPNTENLAAPEANLLLDENGFVHVDENCRTNLPGVYAIGGLNVLGPTLAHKGIEEGIFVAEHIIGKHNPINYDTLPSVIYTDPEIAWVGQTEQALNAIAEPINIGIAPINANLRAQVAGANPEGMVKIITHAKTDAILGIHIIATNASEMLTEAVLAMEFSASSEDLIRTIQAHPTYSETLREAALALKKRALLSPV